MLKALMTEFARIKDPRCDWKVEHKLIDILVIAVCAVVAEAETFEDIALYGRCKESWLRRFLDLPNGIPSHDTFRRVLMLIDAEAFERCFLGWVRAIFRNDPAPRQIAIDGKCVRRSFDRKRGRSPLASGKCVCHRAWAGAGAARHRRDGWGACGGTRGAGRPLP